MTLWDYFLNNPGRQIHKWRHYFPIYEKHFERFVNRPVSMLEIGCGHGGSLQMWKNYLGPMARIVGVDILKDRKQLVEEQIDIRIGDQGDPEFLKAVADEFGPFDIILDDGSHLQEHMWISFETLYPRVTPTGVYMIEDTHCCYRKSHGGGLKAEGSFMEFCKDLIDSLNAEHARDQMATTEFTRSTLSISFYDSMIAFEKGRQPRKKSFITGKRMASYEAPQADTEEGNG